MVISLSGDATSFSAKSVSAVVFAIVCCHNRRAWFARGWVFRARVDCAPPPPPAPVKKAQRMLPRNEGITFVCRKCACPKPDAALVCVAAVDCYVPRVACVCRPEEVVIESLCAFSKAAVEQMACKSMRNAIEFFSYNAKQPGMPSWFKEMGNLTTTTFTQLAESSTWYTHNTELIDAIGNPLGTVLHNRSVQYAGKIGEPTHGTAVRIKCADGDVLLTQAWVFAMESKSLGEAPRVCSVVSHAPANANQGGQGC